MVSEQETWDVLGSDDPMYAAWGADGDGVEECLEFVENVVVDGPEWAWVLDLGCGPGRLLGPLARSHPQTKFVGVDVSPVMLGAAAETMPGNVRLLPGDGRELPMQTGFLRGAYSVLMFQHIPDDAVRGYLGQVSHLLLDGAKAVFQYVSGDSKFFLNHHRTPDEMRSWCEEAGLRVTAHAFGGICPEWNWIEVTK